jgi:hypothetical protein
MKNKILFLLMCITTFFSSLACGVDTHIQVCVIYISVPKDIICTDVELNIKDSSDVIVTYTDYVNYKLDEQMIEEFKINYPESRLPDYWDNCDVYRSCMSGTGSLTYNVTFTIINNNSIIEKYSYKLKLKEEMDVNLDFELYNTNIGKPGLKGFIHYSAWYDDNE